MHKVKCQIFYYALILIILAVSCPALAGQVEQVIDESAAIDQGMKYINEIKKRIANGTLKGHAFAIIGKRIMSFPDPNNWPPGTEESIVIYMDHANRILRSVESPVSKSGDWFIFYEQYFNEDGNTVSFYRHLSSFNRGCTELLREDTYRFFGDDHKLLAEIISYSDKDGKKISPDGCNYLYQFEYMVDKTVGDFLQRKLLAIE